MPLSIKSMFSSFYRDHNPFYHPAVTPKADAGIRLGLHVGTNFLAKTNGMNTVAKVAAFATDLFIAIPCNVFALLFNILTLAPLRNIFIRISNNALKEQDKIARKSWKPDYEVLAADVAIIAFIALGMVIGYYSFVINRTLRKDPCLAKRFCSQNLFFTRLLGIGAC